MLRIKPCLVTGDGWFRLSFPIAKNLSQGHLHKFLGFHIALGFYLIPEYAQISVFSSGTFFLHHMPTRSLICPFPPSLCPLAKCILYLLLSEIHEFPYRFLSLGSLTLLCFNRTYVLTRPRLRKHHGKRSRKTVRDKRWEVWCKILSSIHNVVIQ